MRPAARWCRLIGHLLAAGLLAWAATVHAEAGSPCAALPVVISGSAADVAEVCAASRVALERLAELGLAPNRTLNVGLVDMPILHGGGLAYGQYDGGRDRIELMSPAAIAAQQPPPAMFGIPIDGPMYAGLVAHELAHAVAQQHRRADKLGSPAQEYLAYAVQLASLPAPLRETIVAGAGVRGWEAGDTVSTIYLGMNAHRFAVKSYLHLYGHPELARAMEAVLASRGNVTFTAP